MTDRIGYLEAWYVDADVRGQGIGRTLAQAAEQWAREQGCRETASDTAPFYPISPAAHAALGYETVAWHFRKELTQKQGHRQDGFSRTKSAFLFSRPQYWVEPNATSTTEETMDNSTQAQGFVMAGEDCLGEKRGLGVSTLTFKTSSAESSDLFVVENGFHQPGGPARHLHHSQDEWFYALEGDFIIEVGDHRATMHPGDAFFAPRAVPHVWACISPTGGRMLVTFAPAGQMEAFFREVTKANAMPPQDPALWRAHGMELLGPPLALEAKVG